MHTLPCYLLQNATYFSMYHSTTEKNKIKNINKIITIIIIVQPMLQSKRLKWSLSIVGTEMTKHGENQCSNTFAKKKKKFCNKIKQQHSRKKINR